MIKITELERTVLAAWFARSNMGQPRLDGKRIKDLLRSDRKWPLDLESAVNAVCNEFMETDEHEKMFYDEAKSWYKTFSPRGKYATREAIVKTWPHVEKCIWPEVEV